MVPFSVPRILLTIYLPSSWGFKQPAARARLSACKLTSGTVWRRSFNPDFATIVLAVLWECNSDIRQSGELKPKAEGSFEQLCAPSTPWPKRSAHAPDDELARLSAIVLETAGAGRAGVNPQGS